VSDIALELNERISHYSNVAAKMVTFDVARQKPVLPDCRVRLLFFAEGRAAVEKQ
jgi:hypothetical protein